MRRLSVWRLATAAALRLFAYEIALSGCSVERHRAANIRARIREERRTLWRATGRRATSSSAKVCWRRAPGGASGRSQPRSRHWCLRRGGGHPPRASQGGGGEPGPHPVEHEPSPESRVTRSTRESTLAGERCMSCGRRHHSLRQRRHEPGRLRRDEAKPGAAESTRLSDLPPGHPERLSAGLSERLDLRLPTTKERWSRVTGPRASGRRDAPLTGCSSRALEPPRPLEWGRLSLPRCARTQ